MANEVMFTATVEVIPTMLGLATAYNRLFNQGVPSGAAGHGDMETGIRRVIITARIKSFTVGTKKSGEETVKTGRIVLEYEDLDDWQLDLLGELADGMDHEVAIDERVSVRNRTMQPPARFDSQGS